MCKKYEDRIFKLEKESKLKIGMIERGIENNTDLLKKSKLIGEKESFEESVKYEVKEIKEQFNKRLAEIKEAYEALKTDGARKLYDDQLKEKELEKKNEREFLDETAYRFFEMSEREIELRADTKNNKIIKEAYNKKVEKYTKVLNDINLNSEQRKRAEDILKKAKEYYEKINTKEKRDTYKKELINRFFSSYINESCSSILRSNIEFVAPILWKVLPKDVMLQISKRVDNEISKANSITINYAFSFMNIVDSKKYLTTRAKKYLLAPIIEKLTDNLDNFHIEDQCVSELARYAGYIPRELLYDYVNALTQTYVGHIGSCRYERTDFYANGASLKIPVMFESFDDESAHAFVDVIKKNKTLQRRIKNKVKLDRLRILGEIVNRKISENFDELEFLNLLLKEENEKSFFDTLNT